MNSSITSKGESEPDDERIKASVVDRNTFASCHQCALDFDSSASSQIISIY